MTFAKRPAPCLFAARSLLCCTDNVYKCLCCSVQHWSQLPIYAFSHFVNPLSALSGQSYGCRISLKLYVQLQPMLVVSRCQPQTQQPGCFMLGHCKVQSVKKFVTSSNFTHCITWLACHPFHKYIFTATRFCNDWCCCNICCCNICCCALA